MLWYVEGFLKWYLSTHVSKKGLVEEELSMFLMGKNMVEKYTAWKG
jgi:hypothetical protein